MQLTAGGSMLNFGYWDRDGCTPAVAQNNLCSLVSNIAGLNAASSLVDIGSGLGAPAARWKSDHSMLDISCVNINYRQLLSASNSRNNSNGMAFVNATSTALPFAGQSIDRVIALESAQHFKPLGRFVSECSRILKPSGALVIAMPVTTRHKTRIGELFSLGLLSFTWSSEHYGLDRVKSAIMENGFSISEEKLIGKHVYQPLADYYVQNREQLRQEVLKEYSSFVEGVLYRSLLKMKDVSEKGIIDYVIIQAHKGR